MSLNHLLTSGLGPSSLLDITVGELSVDVLNFSGQLDLSGDTEVDGTLTIKSQGSFLKNIRTINSATILNKTYANKLTEIFITGTMYNIILPIDSELTGAVFDFMVKQVGSQSVTFTPVTANFRACVYQHVTSTGDLSSVRQVLTFGNTLRLGNTSAVGDQYRAMFDGVTWSISGNSSVQGAVTGT